MRQLALLALAIPLLAAAAPSVPSTLQAPQTPQTVALLSAIGDRVEVVRQLRTSGHPADPYRRKATQVSSQVLNHAVLRGMDKALTEDEPTAQHVLLQWDMPADLADKMQKASGSEREDLVLGALAEHLQSLPERQQWDRIEVIVPAYTDLDMKGVGTKLSGIGVYVQALEPQTFDLDGIADGSSVGNSVVTTETDGDYRTINPKTGETAHASTYVAPFMYFERLTYDAKSMALIKRQRFFDNTKYADPSSRALDVGEQMTKAELIGKLVESVERAAYRSIRPVTGDVKVTTPKVLLPAPASDGASSAR